MKKTILLIGLSIVFAATCMAAETPEYPYQKQIAKGEYAKAETEILKKLTQSPDDIPLLYAATQLYFASGNPQRDIRRAYTYACECNKYYRSASAKDVAKWEKNGLTAEVVASAVHDCCIAARDIAHKADQTEEYESFLRTYTECSSSIRDEVTVWRNNAAYRDACRENTVKAYERFLHLYPDAEQVADAQNKIYDIAYNAAVNSNRNAAYTDFISTYRYSPQILDVLNRLHPGTYKQGGITAFNWKEHIPAATDTAESELAATMLTQRELMRLAVAGTNYEIAKFGYYNFYDPMLDSCWLVLHKVHSATGQLRDLQDLYRYYPNDHFPNLKSHEQQVLAACQKFYTDQSMSEEDFIRAAAPDKIAYDQLIRAISPNLNTGNISACIRYCEQFARQFGDDSRYNSLLDILKAKDEKVEKRPLPAAINTAEGKEYLPIPSADGNTMYFVGTSRRDNLGGEDIFVATRDSFGTWQPATIVRELSNAQTHEGVHSVSTNGASLIVFKEGKLQITDHTADGWSAMTPLPDNINISSWQCDAMISSDGKAMLFAARYPTAYEKDTSINIFVSLRDTTGQWGTPFDIGPAINTPYIDRSPFLHPDMKTLYFSSGGHGGLGGLDVYKSTRLNDDSWTEWSEPVNIGKQLNTTRNDWGYKFTTDGKTAYFSDGDDIYSVALPESMRPNAVATVSGHVTDGYGTPVKVVIRWEDLDNHKDIGQSETDAADGSFFLVLPLGRLYGYYIDDERFYPLSNNIDLRDITEMTTIRKDIQLVSYKQMVEEGMAVNVNNLFFPVNEWELLPQSENELLRVAAIINAHNFRVEISGHTDASGDAKKNKVLSQQRADSVRDFLIQAGCNPDMLTAKGYGSTKPVADNTTDEGKQLNRRVELRFLDN